MRTERRPLADAGTLLIRALRLSSAAAGCPIRIDSLAARPWSSATFTGTQVHVLLSATASDRLDGWIAALPRMELPVRGHLVADLVVDEDRIEDRTRRIALAVLTLVEG